MKIGDLVRYKEHAIYFGSGKERIQYFGVVVRIFPDHIRVHWIKDNLQRNEYSGILEKV